MPRARRLFPKQRAEASAGPARPAALRGQAGSATRRVIGSIGGVRQVVNTPQRTAAPWRCRVRWGCYDSGVQVTQGPYGARWHHPAVPNPLPSPVELAQGLTRLTRRLGFIRTAIAKAEALQLADERWREFLTAGRHGSMGYLTEGERAAPRSLLPEASSVICVALPYGDPRTSSGTLTSAGGAEGALAGYAQGADYHPILWGKLLILADELAQLAGRPILARPCVDSAPLLERALAAEAGLGFVGKHGLVIAPGAGSYFVLGELLVSLDLPPSQPAPGRCGSCTACLDACPTGAFVGPYQLDARRCISYLTIEHKGSIPRELRGPIGDRVFGCDVCQAVCPFNGGRGAQERAEELESRRAGLDLVALLELGSAGYRKLVRGSALRRATREQLARNAAVALGNLGDARFAPQLGRALREHPGALVREHAAWALGRLWYPGGAPASAITALTDAERHDEAPEVRAEARRARLDLLDPSREPTYP